MGDDARDAIRSWRDDTDAWHPSKDAVPVMHISDSHCNLGMAGVDSIVAEELDVNIIAHTGDFTTEGTSHEEKCVTVIKNKVGDKVKVIGVLGATTTAFSGTT